MVCLLLRVYKTQYFGDDVILFFVGKRWVHRQAQALFIVLLSKWVVAFFMSK